MEFSADLAGEFMHLQTNLERGVGGCRGEGEEKEDIRLCLRLYLAWFPILSSWQLAKTQSTPQLHSVQ
jgi:hypothetical protein